MQKGDIPNELSPLGDEYGVFYCFFKIKSKVNENVDIRPWVYTIQHFFESETARVKNAVHTYYAMKDLLHKDVGSPLFCHPDILFCLRTSNARTEAAEAVESAAGKFLPYSRRTH